MPAAVPAWQPPPATAQQTPAVCVPAIATRIPVPPSECSPFGSHSGRDLERTGQQNVAVALQMIDTRVQAHGSGP